MDFYDGLFRSRIGDAQVPEQNRLVCVPEEGRRDPLNERHRKVSTVESPHCVPSHPQRSPEAQRVSRSILASASPISPSMQTDRSRICSGHTASPKLTQA